jgi:polyhydroxyalkanoate synthesis repressor PhaR
VIKRYPNRKLYNTETNKYVTLEGIGDLIRRGDEIHVIDHATGEDLTVLILAQVLFEQAKSRAGFLPRTLLTGLIQAGGGRISAIHRSLAASLGAGQPVDDEIERRIEILIRQGELEAGEGERLREKLISLGGERRQRPVEAAVERGLAARGLATRRELGELLEKIDSLAARLDEMVSEQGPDNDDAD